MAFYTHPARLMVAVLSLALVLATLLVSTPARSAEPGSQILSFSGALGPGVPSRELLLFQGGPANMRLAVSGGAPGDTLTLALLDAAGNQVGSSWSAHSDETIWATADLPIGGKLRVQTTAATLNFDLQAYARGTVLAPTEIGASLSGTLIGAGAQTSTTDLRLVVPTAGLYSLSLGAQSGGYQLMIGENVVRKTVVSGQAPAPADTTYYLPVGSHTFRIIPDTRPAVKTEWSVQVAPAGALDSLPVAEATAALGGNLADGTFVEEWVPIQMAATTAVNLRIEVGGGASDTLRVELYNGTSKVFDSLAVAGQEIIWGTSQLTAGANALHVTTTAGNAQPLSYKVELSAIGQPELTLSGASQGTSAANSTARVTFPADGLYNFALTATSGRYQLRLNDTYLRRIVTTAGSNFTAFVPAGTHQLVLDQDSATGAAWTLTVAAVDAVADTLPFTRGGVTLGGAGKDFADERLPLALAAGQPVNLRIEAKGNAGDRLRVELFGPEGTAPFAVETVYADEITWATTNIAAGATVMRVSAAETNAGPMTYTVDIHPVSAIPVPWSGVAQGGGLNSNFTLVAPEDGLYTVVLTLNSGAGQVLIDNDVAPMVRRGASLQSAGSTLTMRVPLTAGLHRFTLEHDRNQPVTSWSVTTTLYRSSGNLSVMGVTPPIVSKGPTSQLTIVGTGFESGTTVELMHASGKVAASYAVIDANTILMSLPADAPEGDYTVYLRNPGGVTASRPAALSVGNVRVYLPMVMR